MDPKLQPLLFFDFIYCTYNRKSMIRSAIIFRIIPAAKIQFKTSPALCPEPDFRLFRCLQEFSDVPILRILNIGLHGTDFKSNRNNSTGTSWRVSCLAIFLPVCLFYCCSPNFIYRASGSAIF